MKQTVSSDSPVGMMYAIFAYTLWAIFPIYWKLVDAFNPMFLLAFRIFSSFIVMVFISIVTKNYRNMYISKRYILTVFVAAIFLSSNWYLYIYSVTTNRVLDSSLAYYISPIISMLFGIIIFREKKTALEYSAIVVAIIAIAYKTISLNTLPVLSLGISITMSVFNIMKKITLYNEIKSTMLETTVVVIPAIVYIFYSNPSTFDVSGVDWLFISLSGIVTTVPLLLFSKASKMIKLSTLGFFQFIVPITSTILAVFLYKEPLTKSTVITFLLIFISVSLYIISLVKNMKQKNILN